MSDPLADPLGPSGTGRNPATRAGSAPASDATQLARRAAAPRVSRLELLKLAAQLPDRDRRIVETVGMLRLARTDQLRRLFFSELTTENARTRVCRRSLQRLTETQLLRPLERRMIGGSRAGSSGQVYALAPAGRRLLAHVAGHGAPSNRGVHEPGLLFLTHTLAIGDLYLALIEADRDGKVDLLSFEPEPTRTYTSPIGATMTLKPDAYVRLGIGDYEQLSYCELDQGTEGRGALERKLHAYLALYRSGREQAEHGLFPRVVWITPSETRAAYISSLVDALPTDTHQLFATTTTERAPSVLTGVDVPTPEGEPS